MWTCPKCTARNWEGAITCNRCQADRSGQLLPDGRISRERPGHPFYSITLSPGEVRYLKLKDFLAVDIDDWINTFRQLSPDPQIEGPWSAGLELCSDESWSGKLRIQHAFGNLHRNFGVPEEVYCSFHSM